MPMPVRKSIRRRSNWYIYAAAFIITAALLSFAVWSLRDMIFPQNTASNVSSSGKVDYRPDASFNTNIMLMLSESKGGIPEYYMLMNYRPRDEVIVLVPIKENLSSEVGNARGSLSDIYAEGGSEWVIYAVQNVFDITCENYIKFDKTSFIDFFDLIGKTPINIPYLIKNENIEFSAGSHELNGEMLYHYLTFPELGEGEDYRSVVHGSAISSFINYNSRNLTASKLQSFFNKLLNTTDTDYEFSDFTESQSALIYNTQNSYNMAEYYIPYGDTDENGLFVISENSKATIKIRFGEE